LSTPQAPEVPNVKIATQALDAVRFICRPDMLSGAWAWIESSPSNSCESIKHLPLERASTICSHHPAATAAAASSLSSSSSSSSSLAPSGVEEAQFLVHITCVCLKRAEWCL